MRHRSQDGDLPRSTPSALLTRVLTGWIIVAVSLGIAAVFFTSRSQPAIGQTGPAIAPPASTPKPPAEKLEVFVEPFARGAETYKHSRSDVRLLDVLVRESNPGRRRLALAVPNVADEFIDATMGGQPLIGVQISVGATGRGTLAGSLTRAQLARLCFPSYMKPPGIDVESLVVIPGRLVTARLDRHVVCVEFVFTEPGAFVVGTRPKPVLPEFADYYASTGGAATWGPCLTQGFFVSVGPDGTIIETQPGLGVYIQVCANGVLGYHPELAGTGYEIQPVLASHWVLDEGGRFVGPDPPVRSTGAGQYFPQTGHNVSGALMARFLALGGVDVVGYPLTEALPAASGFTDQYFQHVKLRMDDATGTVSIRPVGREFIAMLAANHGSEATVP